jgi:endonuclease III
MAKPSRSRIERALLDRHGRTYAEELGINLARETPSALFKLLVAAILLSARIGAKQGTTAARALFAAGWTTPRKLADSAWEERVRVLNRNGYARYDERTATMLGQAAELLLERYGGDLRKLREEAGRDPVRERALLRQLKGLGNVGVDIFFREVQVAWEELYPFADERALAEARSLGLPGDPKALARGHDREAFARLVAALIRSSLAKDREQILQAAAAG